MTSPSITSTSGTPSRCTPFCKVDWSRGGRSKRKDRQSVFCTAVSPLDIQLHQAEVEYDLEKHQNRTVQAYLEASWQYSILMLFENCSEKGIAILSNSHTQSLFQTHYQRCGLQENWWGPLLQSASVTQVTSRNTCTELATRSEGCTCFRIARIQCSWQRVSPQEDLWQ